MPDEAAAQVNIEDAETILERVEHGEEVVITRAGTPVARVVPPERRAKRGGRGSLRGALVMAADWDSDEVNDAIARGAVPPG
jgi:antitoxin (DNA-binding transcriptional repressor) of toxin-antitoxin stability system